MLMLMGSSMIVLILLRVQVVRDIFVEFIVTRSVLEVCVQHNLEPLIGKNCPVQSKNFLH